jgi:hypothetical protein
VLLTVKVSDVVTLIDSCALRLETWTAGGMFLSSMVLCNIFVFVMIIPDVKICLSFNKIYRRNFLETCESCSVQTASRESEKALLTHLRIEKKNSFR